ncbi:hypothetical protein JOC34_000608 [Virgibacillus halotolerans]|uniref:hypothetical protein n=1 Tax=Virgibacillus halotolerans TaxID=1071053 RepID=UPI001961508B|nr:hypothetical protein [Virgibacillus halotolerans]MBM7598251.1 hypothetical protein [Virgibacillus halotolerans]
MENFLYYLAESKYSMYFYLFKQSARTSGECFSRIKVDSKYKQLLDTINRLPNKEQQRLREIERQYFEDAPYVNLK